MEITNFNELIEASKLQSTPQRLLFLFAKATALENKVKTAHHSGTVEPVMCVDKLPSEIVSFQALIQEADSISSKWDFVLIGSLSGTNGQPPTSKEADAPLSLMSNNLVNGKDISKYVILDREERQIILA